MCLAPPMEVSYIIEFSKKCLESIVKAQWKLLVDHMPSWIDTIPVTTKGNSKVPCILDEVTMAQLRTKNCPLDFIVLKTQLLIF